jgi:hypothetical protein
MAARIPIFTGDGGGGGGDDSGTTTGSGGSFTPPPSTAAPPPVVQPTQVSGASTGSNEAQIGDFSSEEGNYLAIAYGEHLIAGTLGFHKFTPGTPNQSMFVTVLGEGQGDGGKHGEWNGVVKAWYEGEELANAFPYKTWCDDSAPTGAALGDAEDGWNWIRTNPTPYAGRWAHQSKLLAGKHQHFFQNATDTLSISTGDTLYCFVFLDPTNPPTEVMIAWQDGSGSFEHRAYWGANSITDGTNGTNSRRQVSASVPTPGQWVRIDVAASQVGLEGQTVKGMGFLAFGGLITWDQTGFYHTFTAPGYDFRPGVIPTDTQSREHANVQALSAGVAHSGAANILVVLTSDQASEDRPDKLRVRCQTRRNFDWDANGGEIGYGYANSTNPARVAADRVLAYFEHLYPDNNDLAREKFKSRINWPSWKAWADYNFTPIPWDRYGDGVIQIPRFEANIAFTEDVNLADALDRICAMAGAWWQDDGEQLFFYGPGERDPVHHFNEGNIIGAPRLIPTDLRERPNRFIARFRELDDEFLGEVTAEIRREEAIRRVSEVKSERQFSNMRQSQAQRLLERQARLEADNPYFVTLIGDESSLHLLQADFCTVSHSLLKWEWVKCLVTEIEVQSAEDSPDNVAFTLQRIDGPIYSDTAHTPVQQTLIPS